MTNNLEARGYEVKTTDRHEGYEIFEISKGGKSCEVIVDPETLRVQSGRHNDFDASEYRTICNSFK